MIEILVMDNAFIDSRLISPLPYIIQLFDANNFTHDFDCNFPINNFYLKGCCSRNPHFFIVFRISRDYYFTVVVKRLKNAKYSKHTRLLSWRRFNCLAFTMFLSYRWAQFRKIGCQVVRGSGSFRSRYYRE